MRRSSFPFCRFDFYDRAGGLSPIIFADPHRIVEACTVDEVLPALQDVSRAVEEGAHAAGYVAYDAAAGLDNSLTATQGAMPLLWFGLFDGPKAGSEQESDAEAGEFSVSEWECGTTRARYDADVAAIRAAIARGDTYLVNYTARLRARFAGDSLAFYQRLRAAQAGAGYCAYLNMGRFQVVSVSPELFFRLDGDEIVTRPMKGTAPRGLWTEDDLARAARLAESEKDRAENVMTVDLLRNDLGRIAVHGSVRVPEFFTVERYPTVYQMTSMVTATLRADVGLADVFRALFPSGSVTGPPKISTMRIIAGLENAPRGVYCGAIGYAAPHRRAVFNVAIRTVAIDTKNGAAEYGSGGAVTWDSTSAGEYAELLAKAAVLATPSPDFALLETMRLEGGQYALLDRHLARMAASAAYFGRAFDLRRAMEALDRYAAEFPDGARRVRLLVGPDGGARVEGQALDPMPDMPLIVVLADTPIDRGDRFLYHKTTHRTYYNTMRNRMLGDGAYDVLLWNDRREVTEFTIGNLVVELDGRFWTPPVECGLLPGTLRAELLARGEIAEGIISLDDLLRANRTWLINSVRDWIPVTIAGAEPSLPTSP